MRLRYTAAGIVAGIAIGAAGAAFAATPDGNGVITGCYDPQNGYRLRVLDTATRTKCPHGQRKLTWNHQGPAGPQGARGEAAPRDRRGQPARRASLDRRGRLGPRVPRALRAPRGRLGHRASAGSRACPATKLSTSRFA
jgi:hypothetical protein